LVPEAFSSKNPAFHRRVKSRVAIGVPHRFAAVEHPGDACLITGEAGEFGAIDCDHCR
jgi:hypothetical protein